MAFAPTHGHSGGAGGLGGIACRCSSGAAGLGGGLLGSLGSGSAPIQDEDRLEVRVWAADHRDRTRVDDAQNGFPARA